MTVVFTDLVRSTAVLDRLGDDAGRGVLRRYLDLLRGAVRAAGGREVKSLGDGLMVAFSSPLDGLRCGVAMQAAVAAEKRTHPETSLGLRVGVHAGEPLEEAGDLFGTTVVVASRLCDRAREGQILASELVSVLAGEPAGFAFRRLGRLRLKGLDTPLAVVEVTSEEQPEEPSRERLPRAARPETSRPGLTPRFVPASVSWPVWRLSLSGRCRASRGACSSPARPGSARRGWPRSWWTVIPTTSSPCPAAHTPSA
ncbi:MAG TPA: adenylate/guanylate cyclase domain-containing protein [Acidimicrobiia bacterium]|nr:adenylate/guanylate cyclase domain-containing protein [Acidimicrobiia bacterium]